MSQPEFILRSATKRHYLVTNHVRVAEIELNRPTKSQPMPGLFRMVEGTGRYSPDHLFVRATPGDKRFAFGEVRVETHVGRTAEGVKKVIRRVRPQEAALLDAADTEVEATLAAWKAAKAKREALLTLAWSKGNVVRLNEVEAVLGTACGIPAQHEGDAPEPREHSGCLQGHREESSR